MRLKVLLPSEVFVDEEAVKIIAEAENGSFCLKPRHVDFVSALAPGLLFFISENGIENMLAVDEGTLVKCGNEVLISVRNAVRGTKLSELKKTIEASQTKNFSSKLKKLIEKGEEYPGANYIIRPDGKKKKIYKKKTTEIKF